MRDFSQFLKFFFFSYSTLLTGIRKQISRMKSEELKEEKKWKKLQIFQAFSAPRIDI
jgi:hypothetical protein